MQSAVMIAAIVVVAANFGGPALPTDPTPVAATAEIVPAALAQSTSVPVGQRVVFVGNYDTGYLNQWRAVHTRDRVDVPGKYCTYSACVRSDGRTHKTAARYEVRDGDVPSYGGGERSEVRSGDGGSAGAYVSEGDERWYELSIKFDSSWVNPRRGSADWFIVMQWIPTSNLPPQLTLDVSIGGALEFGGPFEYRRPIGQVQPGVWVDYVLHVKFSADPAVGFAEAWQNGVQTVPLHNRPTLGEGLHLVKQGVYRDAASSGTQVVWHDGLRITAP